MEKTVYLDNAATTKIKPPAVVKAVADALSGLGNAGRDSASSSLSASRIVYDAREELAQLFGAQSAENIAFTANSTEALNMVISGLILEGGHVVTTVMEHNSVLRPLYRLQREKGVSLTVLPADERGNISLTELEKALLPSTRAVVITHCSNLTGNLNDLGRIGRICAEKKVFFIVDASQSAGIFPIDIEKMHISALCFTGHKSLFGPQGTGGIAVGSDLVTPDGRCVISPLKVGGSGIHTFEREHPNELPTALEAGTLNAHGIAGLLAGVRFIKETGMQVIRQKEDFLARRFYEGVKDIPGVILYGDMRPWSQNEGIRAPIVSLNIGDYDSARIGDVLYTDYGIETRCGGHCAPLMHESFGTAEQGMVRFSFSYFNTQEDVDAAIQAVQKICL